MPGSESGAEEDGEKIMMQSLSARRQNIVGELKEKLKEGEINFGEVWGWRRIREGSLNELGEMRS